MFTEVPAPWHMPNAESWWFITNLAGSGGDANVLPGNYEDGPTEAEARDHSLHGNFQGGMGMIMIVRYTDCPAGPYDELMMIPGRFKNDLKTGPRSALRITRAYVSSLASVYNGRRNWNVPKHLARFTFDPSPSKPDCTQIRVYAGESRTPFFAARVSKATGVMGLVPTIPLDMKYSPMSMALVLPPLGSSDSEGDGLVGTSRWTCITSGFKGIAKPVDIEGLLEPEEDTSGKTKSGAKGRWRFGNGVDFPDAVPYSVGLHWPKATIDFPEATILS